MTSVGRLIWLISIKLTYFILTYYLLHKILTALIQESCIVQTHAKCDLLFDPVTLTFSILHNSDRSYIYGTTINTTTNKRLYAALLPRRGPHIASHSVCPSVCLSLCPSVRPVIVAIGNVFSSTASVTDVLFGTHLGPHIVRPSRPYRFLFYFI